LHLEPSPSQSDMQSSYTSGTKCVSAADRVLRNSPRSSERSFLRRKQNEIEHAMPVPPRRLLVESQASCCWTNGAWPLRSESRGSLPAFNGALISLSYAAIKKSLREGMLLGLPVIGRALCG